MILHGGTGEGISYGRSQVSNDVAKTGIELRKWEILTNMGRILYTLAQLTWGLPQTLVGAVCFLATLWRPHFAYHGAIVTPWRLPYSASMGLFVFLGDEGGRLRDVRSHEELPEHAHRLLVHEYGHTIQSLIFGPLYLFVMAIPSAVWCLLPALERRRARRGTSYYALYTERSADWLGERVTGERSMRARPLPGTGGGAF